MMTEDHILEVCKEFGFHIKNKSLIGSAISSYHYYEDLIDKISSIFRGLLKNHPLQDGNKRLACIMLLEILRELGINYVDDDVTIYNFVIDVASNDYTIKEISQKLLDEIIILD